MANVRPEVLVVCLVDSSVDLLYEWNDVLLTYVSPLLQRIATGSVIKGSRSDMVRFGLMHQGNATH